MANIERVRELLSSPPGERYFRDKFDSGWRLVAIDWERDVPASDAEAAKPIEPVPYGLQISSDCRQLQEDSNEQHALMRMMEMIVKDRPLSEVAADLNQGGYRTRQGAQWTPAAVFDMLPRLIEVGPRILTNDEYVARRRTG